MALTVGVLGGAAGSTVFGPRQFPVCYNPYSCIQEIVAYSLELLILKKFLIPLIFLSGSAMLVNCGGSTGGGRTSGVAYRAFVSNPVGGGVNIVNADTDLRATGVSPISAGSTPGMMVVTPNRTQTLVFSGYGTANPDNELTIIDNGKESGVGQNKLPGSTASIVVSPDSFTAYVAVPLAPVGQQPQGAIEVLALTGQNPPVLIDEIAIPSVQYLSINNGGDRILGFSPNSDSIAVVTPSNINTGLPTTVFIAGFNQPVQAFFSSDDSTAYVVNCGYECGGAAPASIQPLDMTTNPPTPGAAVSVCTTGSSPQCAASEALLVGSTLYVAGTPYSGGPNNQPSFSCSGAQGETLTCGMLSIVSLGPAISVVTSGIPITDGYHNRIALGANGQLFIGARTCTEIVPPDPPPAGAEVRGCLSIYNTLTTAAGNVPAGAVVIPPVNGDVTGIQPITKRDVIYVVQGFAVPGGSLYIYCAAIDSGDNCPTVDAFQVPPTNNPTYAPLMVGNFYDVVTVDF